MKKEDQEYFENLYFNQLENYITTPYLAAVRFYEGTIEMIINIYAYLENISKDEAKRILNEFVERKISESRKKR